MAPALGQLRTAHHGLVCRETRVAGLLAPWNATLPWTKSSEAPWFCFTWAQQPLWGSPRRSVTDSGIPDVLWYREVKCLWILDLIVRSSLKGLG